MNTFQDAFISYGRADSKQFAKNLNDRLVSLGYTIWFDFEDIPLGVDYQKQIDDAIAKSDNIIFVIAPHSVNSPYCKLEIDLAVHYRKRVIPILHVEQISRETWQNRNPSQTEEDWQAYQAAGKHSSFVNLHPEVSRINWVYMRENLDDFESGFEGLLSIMDRQKEYVHRHTVLLDRALGWQNQNKQNDFLLTGEELLQSEQWLQTRFSQDQPPCYPVLLHCEFIVESLKYSQGGVTHVFLCYDDHDRNIAETLYKSLIRRGITVWMKHRDLLSSIDETVAIETGIEASANFLYIISERSLVAATSLQALNYAAHLHKRIIPIQTTADLSQCPEILQGFNTIDLSDNLEDSDYDQDEAELLKILKTEEKYYETQRDLLIRALRWERQNYNHSILLRGFQLEKLQVWMNIAQRHPQHPPIDLQIEFLKASALEPSPEVLDIFLCCIPTDLDIGRRFHDALQLQGKLVYFNLEMMDLADLSDINRNLDIELLEPIQSCSNCVFIVSQNSLVDPLFCSALDHGIDLNKRMILVKRDPVDLENLPIVVDPRMTIALDENHQDFSSHFNQLIRILEVDREYVQEHTRWLQRSLTWQEHDRSSDLLLRGHELGRAMDWLTAALQSHKQPEVTALQQDFIEASQAAQQVAEAAEKEKQERLLQLQADRAKEAEARLVAEQKIAQRQKLFLIAVSTGLMVSIVLTLLAFWSYRRSVLKANLAAEREVETLTELSNSQFITYKTLESLVTAIKARRQLDALIPNFPKAKELLGPTSEMLQQSLSRIKEKNRLSGEQGRVFGVAISPDGHLIATGGDDRTLRLWTREGALVKALPGNQGRILSVAFSPDGQQIASAGSDGSVMLWQKSGESLHRLKTQQAANVLVFNPFFQRNSPPMPFLVTGDTGGNLQFWSSEGKRLRTIAAHDKTIAKVVFCHHSPTMWTVSLDGTLKHWDVETGELLQTLATQQPLTALALSPDDRHLIVGDFTGMLEQWTDQGQFLNRWQAHRSVIRDLQISSNGIIASASWDNTIGIWHPDGSQVGYLRDHNGPVEVLAFDPSNPLGLLSGSWDGTVRLWSPNLTHYSEFVSGNRVVRALLFAPKEPILFIAGSDRIVERWSWQSLGDRHTKETPHNSDISALAVSPDGQIVASGSWDGSIALWTSQGQFLRVLPRISASINDLHFTPNAQFILAATQDHHLRRWDLQGNPPQTIAEATDSINTIDLSADGQFLAVGSDDGRWQLLTLEGKPILTVQGHAAPITDIGFIPRSSNIVTASLDRTLKIWTREGVLLKTLVGHKEGVMRLAFHPTENVFASASIDKTIRLWTFQGEPITTIRGYRAGVIRVMFSPDGQFVASGDANGSVTMWHWQDLLKADTLLEESCQWLKDYLGSQRSSSALPHSSVPLCPESSSEPTAQPQDSKQPN